MIGVKRRYCITTTVVFTVVVMFKKFNTRIGRFVFFLCVHTDLIIYNTLGHNIVRFYTFFKNEYDFSYWNDKDGIWHTQVWGNYGTIFDDVRIFVVTNRLKVYHRVARCVHFHSLVAHHEQDYTNHANDLALSKYEIAFLCHTDNKKYD